jgi:hypothetical protein
MVARETPLIRRRVPSVFASNEEQQAEAMDTDESDESETDSGRVCIVYWHSIQLFKKKLSCA